jgi:hypothetical protein
VRCQSVGARGRGGLTLAVVAEGHLRLAEANGVFPLGDAIELFELGLVDTLHKRLARWRQLWGAAQERRVRAASGVKVTCLAGEVQLNGFDTDVCGAGGHGCNGLRGFCGGEGEVGGERIVLAKRRLHRS